MKYRHSGVSIVIALGTSLFVLGVASLILKSHMQSFEQTTNIERANQVFYATESGLEAAFFHHNARGQGVHFCPALSGNHPDLCDMTAVSDAQKIILSDIGAQVNWTINGRRNPVTGLLHENQNREVPLSWDDSADPTEMQNQDGKLSLGFTLTFDNSHFLNGSLHNFDFGDASTDGNNQVLIDWGISRKSSDTGNPIETFVPSDGAPDTNPVVCARNFTGKLKFLCENSFRNDSPFSISSASTLTGRKMVTTGSTDDTFSHFFPNDGTDYKLFFHPLLRFEQSQNSGSLLAGTRIPGISYTLQASNNIALPRTDYIVTSQVQMTDFQKTLTLLVPESTTEGSFNYVILE